jgi:hypothetical protein
MPVADLLGAAARDVAHRDHRPLRVRELGDRAPDDVEGSRPTRLALSVTL